MLLGREDPIGVSERVPAWDRLEFAYQSTQVFVLYRDGYVLVKQMDRTFGRSRCT